MPSRRNKASRKRNMNRVPKDIDSTIIGSHISSSSEGKHSSGDRSDPASSGQLPYIEVSSGKHVKTQSSYVEHVGIASSSGEDNSAYTRRVGQPGYTQKVRNRALRRRVVTIIIIALVVILVAAAVGFLVYFTSTTSRLSSGISNATDALTEPVEGEPYYVLCEGSFGSAFKEDDTSGYAYCLARVDETSKALTFIAIPGNLNVRASDGNTYPLYELDEINGQAELIRDLASVFDVDIAHFISIDMQGMVRIVDALGGVDMVVSYEIDDPYAGCDVLNVGEYSLDASGCLTLLRATNFQDGITTAFENRNSFMCACISKITSLSSLDFATVIGDMGEFISTDFTTTKLISLHDIFSDFDEAVVYCSYVPGHTSAENESVYVVDEGEFSDVCEIMKIGQDPSVTKSSTELVNPSDVSIEVLNGADIAGAAANMASILEDAGYIVESVGNVEDYTTYPETLVIYHDAIYEPACRAIIETVGGGRVVDGGDYYIFSTNVLVIIGQDWIPLL